MKKFLLYLLLPIYSFSQIPNASFENWTDNQPDGWWTTNIAGFFEPVTQSSDAHSGDYAVKGEVIEAATSVYIPNIQLNDGESTYIDIDQKYTRLNGYYKFFSQDTFEVFFGAVTIANAELTSVFGVGSTTIKENASTYTPFSIPIEYFTSDAPEKLSVYFLISSDTIPNLGTYFVLDDLSLSTVTGLEKHLVDTPGLFSLKQNYPNPFNPQTKIDYTLPESGNTRIVVFDSNGREVKTLVDSYHSAGSYSVPFNGIDLPSGIYFYRLTSGAFSETRKMMLLK